MSYLFEFAFACNLYVVEMLQMMWIFHRRRERTEEGCIGRRLESVRICRELYFGYEWYSYYSESDNSLGF